MKRNFAFLLLLCMVLLVACRQCGRDKEPVIFTNNPLPEYDTASGLILYLKTAATHQEAIAFLKTQGDLMNKNLLDSLDYCLPCDSTLFRIKGLPFDTLKVWASTGESDIKQAGKPSGTGASGGWGPFLYSPNYRIRSIAPVLQSLSDNTQRFADSPDTNNDTLTIGVLDTGIDTLLSRAYRSGSATCQPGTGSGFGWNFRYNTSNSNDDFDTAYKAGGRAGHGTPVTGFILQQNNGGPPLHILPVKVLDSTGGCGLFELMCGLSYAQKAGARIVNASLGFYSPYTDQVAMFDTFIQKLTSSGMIVVAAAGNTNHLADSMDSRRAIDPVAAADLRNLEKHLFYPAAFSETNPNIITVTTIQRFPGDSIAQNLPPDAYRYQVVDSQNYSPAKVQVGVLADAGKSFYSPFPGIATTWQGSSFATPIVTGLLAANYYRLKLNTVTGKIDRNAVLQNLFSQNGGLGLTGNQLKPGSPRPLPAFAITNRKQLKVRYYRGRGFFGTNIRGLPGTVASTGKP